MVWMNEHGKIYEFFCWPFLYLKQMLQKAITQWEKRDVQFQNERAVLSITSLILYNLIYYSGLLKNNQVLSLKRSLQCLMPEIMQNMLLLWLAVTTNKMHYAVKKSYDFMSTPFSWKGFVLSHGSEYLRHLINLTSCFFSDSKIYKHQKM